MRLSTTTHLLEQFPTSRTRQARHLLVRRTVSLNNPVPRLSLLAFVRGQYMPLGSSYISARWLALCFPGSLHTAAIQGLNLQANALAQEGVVMLLTLSDTRLLRMASREDLQKFTVPIVTDPLNRIHRSYGIQRRPPFSQPTTFLIDPDRILRLEIDHALNDLDLVVLRETMRVKLTSPSTDESAPSQKGNRHAMCAR